MVLTKREVEHIAGLARIRLTVAEKEKMTEDLGAILGYVEKLNQVNTDGVELIAQVTGLENILRQDLRQVLRQDDLAIDLAIETGKYTEQLVSQFPHKKENYLKVKKVFSNKE